METTLCNKIEGKILNFQSTNLKNTDAFQARKFRIKLMNSRSNSCRVLKNHVNIQNTVNSERFIIIWIQVANHSPSTKK